MHALAQARPTMLYILHVEGDHTTCIYTRLCHTVRVKVFAGVYWSLLVSVRVSVSLQ